MSELTEQAYFVKSAQGAVGSMVALDLATKALQLKEQYDKVRIERDLLKDLVVTALQGNDY